MVVIWLNTNHGLELDSHFSGLGLDFVSNPLPPPGLGLGLDSSELVLDSNSIYSGLGLEIGLTLSGHEHNTVYRNSVAIY